MRTLAFRLNDRPRRSPTAPKDRKPGPAIVAIGALSPKQSRLTQPKEVSWSEVRPTQLMRADNQRVSSSSRLAAVGVGFGRTGTMSLKIALEHLGLGPCYHMTEVAKHPHHAALWTAAAGGAPADWARLFARYKSTVDWPACEYYRDLLAVFPDAKFILTVRDPTDWYDSLFNTLFSLKLAMDRQSALRSSDLDTSLRDHIVYDNRIWEHTFAGRFMDRRYAIEVYQRHNDDVVARIPRNKLLVYQVTEGWAPLCEFLHRGIPEIPFPRTNDTEGFRLYNRMFLGDWK